MNKMDIIALFDQQERKENIHPDYQREATPEVVRHIHPDPARRSFIIYSALTAVNADQIIKEQIARYQSIKGSGGLEWKTYSHDTPPDLGDRLIAHGFKAEERETVLTLEINKTPPILRQSETIDLRRLTSSSQMGEIADLQGQVWGGDFGWLQKQLTHNLQTQSNQWAVYGAYVEEMLACAAWIYFPKESQFASLWGGSTLEQYRKMGLYTAVVAARFQEAQQRGYRFLTIDASEMSRPILEKLGFEVLTYTRPFVYKIDRETPEPIAPHHT